MDKIQVFLVDDHAIVRDGLYSLLNTYSDIIVVGEAAEGNEALSKILDVVPNVVIMDLSMPNGRDGLPTTLKQQMEKVQATEAILYAKNEKELLLMKLQKL